MSTREASTREDPRRARNRRLALVLGLIAAAFYLAFIAFGAVQGRG